MSSIVSSIDRHASLLTDMARTIWENPELGLIEFKSSALHAEVLREQGFEVQHGVAGMATAILASFGSGSPVIGLLGEFDALATLSQKLQSTEEPITLGAPGHGCGHNLLGTGSLGAAIALKEAMQAQGLSGTVRYYGCPAEETVDGKAFMAKAGLFSDTDLCISWHPGDSTVVPAASSQAMNGALFTYKGIASHAAGRPEAGRSALDAIELMNVGVNFLREHVPPDVRIHYVITKGGEAPNVVPPLAQSWYYVRSTRRSNVDAVYARVLDVARGAALMTGTELDVTLMGGCWDLLHNNVIGDRLLHHMQVLGAPSFDQNELDLAAALQKTFPEGTLERARDVLRGYGFQPPAPGSPASFLQQEVRGVVGRGENKPGSTDVADVSHITPTAQITVTTCPFGTPGHSWQNVASVGSSIGMKGMLQAAKIMGLAALDFMQQPDLVRAAREEFELSTQDEPYYHAVDQIIPPPHVPADAPWRE